MNLGLIKWINKRLNKFGFQISTNWHAQNQESRYMSCIKELESLYRDTVFKGLKSDKNRVELLANLLGTNPSEGIFICNYIQKVMSLDGDVCEFGVAQGRTSALICNEIINSRKNIWLYDSFKGLPRPSKEDELIDDIFGLGDIEKYSGKMSYESHFVINNLGSLGFPQSRVRIVDGYIDGRLEKNRLPINICFAYIDLDFYKPIKDVLESIQELLVLGGVVIVDDYDFFSSGVKKAVSEFVHCHSEYELLVPDVSRGKFCILTKKG